MNNAMSKLISFLLGVIVFAILWIIVTNAGWGKL